ncbi:sensor histidine kinase [Dokdonia sp. Hel_I_53]|uniref:sensor histidine kinase n=1 Tax=Dokdonia sp. Hel_I_53 TaxID=1566287 RepID=UPI00119C22B8|nr:HAMP domain-containing sensor histidine kinase [Dokdonia sp. Hel_I_53]TVZ52816.1 histidine kinase/DNA gyrase B/HSP90-like ATPase [Dokdonia sp. Hel_I_53]
MNFSARPQIARWFIIIASLIITTLILWNVSLFFDQLKEAERSKMEIYAASIRAFANTSEVNPNPIDKDARILFNELTGLQLFIISENKSIPILLYNLEDDTYTATNIPSSETLDHADFLVMAEEFALVNKPITIGYDGVDSQILYYGNSATLNQIKYFPIALIVIVILFIALIYFYYQTSKQGSQSLLWAGMAKETAHQIGTPLSSLVGWTEILKTEDVDPDYIKEMTKDINRLETITNRFSKIGSIPDLEKVDIISETKEAYDYLSKRSAKLIHFHLDVPQGQLPVMLNKELYGWTFENLVKNAIDAMKGKGSLTITITRDTRYAKINIADTGKGIPKSKYNRIFEPGYTTKKRGWGLGLSLARRIMEEYHDGRIKVLQSDIDKGTTMQISLRLAEE